MALEVHPEPALDRPELVAFDERLRADNILAHWRRDFGPPEPVGQGEACLWKWGRIHQHLLDASDLIGLDEAGRRVLHLCPPGMHATTHTLSMCVQLNMPGEVATAHRHTMMALRFIIQGMGAYTTVEGEAVALYPGDLVTTPSFMYHDHWVDPAATEPVIWIDGLDSPFVYLIDAKFSNRFPTPQQPRTVRPDFSRDLQGIVRPMGREGDPVHQAAVYRWTDVRPALLRFAQDDGDPYDGAVLDYVNPVTGGHMLPTTGCRIQMLRVGERTKRHRHTASVAYHVVEGDGATVVGDRRLEWSKGDCFNVPNWQWHRHEQRGSQPAILWSMHDQPVYEAFGLYREEGE